MFDAYATFFPPDGVEIDAHERAVVQELIEHTADQPRWMGYLDTGAYDIVFLGPDSLIDSLQHNALANAREVQPDHDALPPGRTRE